MAQTKRAFDEVRIPLAKMSFTPDVPSAALGPNEYNDGLNIETDVRGIRAVSGEIATLPDGVPGTPTYISGGFRQPQAGVTNNFYFVVATTEGKWYASNGEVNSTAICWVEITPPGGVGTYTQAQNITEAWSGTIPIFNDEQNPPMFWPEVVGDPFPQLIMYSNLIPTPISDIVYASPTTNTLTFQLSFTSTGSSISGTTLTIGTLGSTDYVPRVGQYLSGTGVTPGTRILSNISGTGTGSTWTVSVSQTVGPIAISGGPYESAPYTAGEEINIQGINADFDGVFEVVSSTMTTVTYLDGAGGAYPGSPSNPLGTVAPRWSWNYNPEWKSVYAKFLRLYNTPNVGNILVAGNLTATNIDDEVEQYPVTVQWSQNFGLNQVPTSWEPTVLNVANQLDVPLRGDALDGFPAGGSFFLCSYWDTVVFSPINYTTTNTPVLGVRLFNQGRGLLSSNCWANTDKMVYGIDSRDIWVFNGQDFQGLGNQRVKNWFYNELDPQYVDRVFMQVNTSKNQIEIYYPTTEATNGVPNKMLAYRYDLDVWNAPRDVNSATFACESPRWIASPDVFYNNRPTVNVLSSGTGARITVQQVGSRYKSYAARGDITVAGSGYAPGNTIKILGTNLGGATPDNDCEFTITTVNGTGGITGFDIPPEGLANGVFEYDPGSRLVVYARGDEDARIVEKDVGYFFLDDINGVTNAITSYFRRDNIKLLEDYSGKLMVHRLLPEVNNLLAIGVPIDPAVNTGRIGSVDITVEGANSVGQAPVASIGISMTTNTDNPWAQINQNAFRVNSVEIGNTSDENIWHCSAMTWQYTQVEDDR
jgi:hypothetical protein